MDFPGKTELKTLSMAHKNLGDGAWSYRRLETSRGTCNKSNTLSNLLMQKQYKYTQKIVLSETTLYLMSYAHVNIQQDVNPRFSNKMHKLENIIEKLSSEYLSSRFWRLFHGVSYLLVRHNEVKQRPQFFERVL